MLHEDAEKIAGLEKTEGFKMLRKMIESSIEKNTSICLNKGSIVNLDDLRYYQGEIAGLRQVLDFMQSAKKKVAKENGR